MCLVVPVVKSGNVCMFQIMIHLAEEVSEHSLVLWSLTLLSLQRRYTSKSQRLKHALWAGWKERFLNDALPNTNCPRRPTESPCQIGLNFKLQHTCIPKPAFHFRIRRVSFIFAKFGPCTIVFKKPYWKDITLIQQRRKHRFPSLILLAAASTVEMFRNLTLRQKKLDRVASCVPN